MNIGRHEATSVDRDVFLALAQKSQDRIVSKTIPPIREPQRLCQGTRAQSRPGCAVSLDEFSRKAAFVDELLDLGGGQAAPRRVD